MISKDLIVSVSGIRSIVGEGLTAEAALAFAAALGTHVQGGRVLLSRDGRPSGKVLRHAVLAGLLGAGCDVEDLDIAPTPTCGTPATATGTGALSARSGSWSSSIRSFEESRRLDTPTALLERRLRTSTSRPPTLRTNPLGIGLAATATLSSPRSKTALCSSAAVAIALMPRSRGAPFAGVTVSRSHEPSRPV